MKTPARSPRSIAFKLQAGFFLAALVLTGAMALFCDWALHHSLRVEDSQVLEAQARAALRHIETGRAPIFDPDARLEHADIRILDAQERPILASPSPMPIPEKAWPASGAPARQFRVGKKTLLLITRAWRRPTNGETGFLQLAMDRSREEELITTFRRVMLLGWLLSSFLAASLCRFIALWGLRPLRRITTQAGSLDYRNLDVRLAPTEFPEELGELVTTLNGALERLQDAFTRLAHLGAELAHELRTPLQNLRSEVESLILRPLPPDRTRDALGSVLEECDRLASMIEKILFLARAENPAAAIQARWMAVGPLLHQILEPFVLVAEERGVNMRVDAPTGLRLHADEALVRRALVNLLSNAIRHTPSGGRVTLGAFARDPGLCLFVTDTGEGIPPEVLPRLGQRFERGKWQGVASVEGHGLGLAIVRGIMALHGGEFTLVSEEGQGTTATLTFPPRHLRKAT